MSRNGFSLVELLIVMLVIGLLATIAIPRFSSTREKAFVASVRTDVRNLASQQEIYFSRNMEYAATTTQLGMVVSAGTRLSINESSNLGWAATGYHSALSGESCGIYHGNAAPSGGGPATTKSVVECTR